MLGFKEYLLEVARDDDRANKLGSYLVKRHSRRLKASGLFDDDYVKDNKSFRLGNDGHEEKDEHDRKHFGKIWSGDGTAHEVFGKRKPNIQDVPVKDLLKRNTQRVQWDGGEKSKSKMNDDRPVNVARSKKTGNLELGDGYHRTAAAWLKGRKTIKANVQDVGDD